MYEPELSLPARSSSFAVTAYVPSTKDEVVQTNEPADKPFEVLHTDPVATPAMYSWARVSFGALAMNDGVAVADMKSESHHVGRHVSDPDIEPGTLGATVSIVRLSAAEALETFPATSVATAVIDRAPSTRTPVVHENAPVPSAVQPVPDVDPSASNSIAASASAVPLIVEVVSFVIESDAEAPLSEPASRESDPGAATAVSTRTMSSAEGSLVCDATVAVAVIDCTPGDKEDVVQENVPEVSAQVDPVGTPLARS